MHRSSEALCATSTTAIRPTGARTACHCSVTDTIQRLHLKTNSRSEPMPDYLTDGERTLKERSEQLRYPYYAVFRLHGGIYTRWYRTPFMRTKHLIGIGAATLSLGQDREPDPADINH